MDRDPIDEGSPAADAETAPPEESAGATDLSTFPRATFLYRLGAVLIDLVMVGFLTYLLGNRRWKEVPESSWSIAWLTGAGRARPSAESSAGFAS